MSAAIWGGEVGRKVDAALMAVTAPDYLSEPGGRSPLVPVLKKADPVGKRRGHVPGGVAL